MYDAIAEAPRLARYKLKLTGNAHKSRHLMTY